MRAEAATPKTPAVAQVYARFLCREPLALTTENLSATDMQHTLRRDTPDWTRGSFWLEPAVEKIKRHVLMRNRKVLLSAPH